MSEETIRIPNTLWAFIWFSLKPYKLILICYLLSGISAMVGFTMMFHYIGEAVDIISNASNQKEEIWRLIKPTLFKIAFFGIVVDSIFGSRLRTYISIFFNERLLFDLRNKIAEYLAHHSTDYFYNDFAGRLATKAQECPNNLAASVNIIMKSGIDAIVSTLMAIILFDGIHWMFGMALSVWAFLFIFVAVFSASKVHKLSMDYSENRSQMGGYLIDFLTNITSVISFSSHEHELKKFKTKTRNVKDIILKKKLFVAHLDIIREVFWQLLFLPLLVLMIWAWQESYVTPGDITMVTSISLVVARYVWGFSNSLVDVYTQFGAVQDAIETIIKPYDVVDLPNAKKLKVKDGEIEFKNVSFKYSKGADIFKKKSLIIQGGEKIGLVGPSGAGKTSFVNLILRLYDVDQGGIMIDGQNIAHVTQTSLREKIAYIPQDPALFHRSIMDNIRYGNLKATKRQIYAAAKKAQIHDFITGLDQGYKTLVGERGVKLSGGQRQRIAIARAILKDAPIIVIDEGTSALDSVTEEKIQKTLYQLMKGRTTIVIAHRLSTLKAMDRLLVMKKGRIIQEGTHHSLLAKKNKLYSTLWQKQVNGFVGV